MRALFTVGEEVYVLSIVDGSKHQETVLLCRYVHHVKLTCDGEILSEDHTGYMYSTTHHTEKTANYNEERLRKLPPRAEFNFDELMVNLNTEKQTA